MDNFVTWDILKDFVIFVSYVFLIVNFTKEMPFIKDIRTKYFSALVAFVLLIVVNLHGGTFELWDLVVYALSAILISVSSNGIADFNNKVTKEPDIK